MKINHIQTLWHNEWIWNHLWFFWWQKFRHGWQCCSHLQSGAKRGSQAFSATSKDQLKTPKSEWQKTRVCACACMYVCVFHLYHWLGALGAAELSLKPQLGFFPPLTPVYHTLSVTPSMAVQVHGAVMPMDPQVQRGKNERGSFPTF